MLFMTGLRETKRKGTWFTCFFWELGEKIKAVGICKTGSAILEGRTEETSEEMENHADILEWSSAAPRW